MVRTPIVLVLALLGAMWCCSGALASSGGAGLGVQRASTGIVLKGSSVSAFARTLRDGQSGADVKTLQILLRDAGYRVSVTGYFDRTTKSAVKRFQLAHRLYPASGSVGVRTASILRIVVGKVTTRTGTLTASAKPTGSDPIPGFSIERDDMGVDASARPGAGIYAPLTSRLVQVMRDWYAGEPLLLFQFVDRPLGALSDYWYVAEQIDPVTTKIGTTFQAGEVVASFARSGTGIEIGWGSPTSNSRTLAGASDSGASDPPAGSKTSWGETFKKFFGIR